MTNIFPIFDLGPLMRALRKRREPGARAAGDALQAYKDARSCLNDLLYVRQLLTYLKSMNMDGAEKPPLPTVVMGAILNNAILFYARATQPSSNRTSDSRRHLNFKSKLNENDRILHDKIGNLRNKSVAHLDQNRPFGDKTFSDESVVIINHKNGDQLIALADRRMAVQLDFQEDFLQLVCNAFDQALLIIEKKRAAVKQHLFALSEDNSDVGRMIEDHPFDAEAFFGDAKVAKSFAETGEPYDTSLKDGVVFPDWPDRPKSDAP